MEDEEACCGESFEYVAEDLGNLEEGLQCCVCLSPLHRPALHVACGNLFCSACVTRLPRPAVCPLCRRPLLGALVPAPLFVMQKVDALRVYCPRARCVVHRCDLPAHLRDTCPGLGASVAPCAAARFGCTWAGKREGKQEHEAECQYCALAPAFERQQARFRKAHAASIASLQAAHLRRLSSLHKQVKRLSKAAQCMETVLQQYTDGVEDEDEDEEENAMCSEEEGCPCGGRGEHTLAQCCVKCGKTWGEHHGHTCPGTGVEGVFL
eukprot:TRINITY_DN3955_c0_g1_i1.p1 TRINITY_DN3955_c0_g1~~TRINITY_DN3955_c0_g1_i1.p1  ORF type:complete len:287 (+),score=78.01 TRINITY_DN3955_c0_g1_i1:65-862(+)